MLVNRMLYFVSFATPIDCFRAGEVLTVSFDIDSREYNGRWYNDIRAWKVDRNVAAPASAPAAPAAGAPVPPPVADPFGAPQMNASSEADDLPF